MMTHVPSVPGKTVCMVYLLTNHEYPHVPHPEELFEEGGEGEPHGDGGNLKQSQLCVV